MNAARAGRIARVFLGRRSGAVCVLAVLVAGGWAWTVDWAAVGAALVSARGEFPVDGALLAEARRLGLDYPEVSADPAAHAGKPVVWCLVRSVNPAGLVVEGNMSRPVEMGGGDFMEMASARMGICRPTLAVVEPGSGPVVRLRFAGHP